MVIFIYRRGRHRCRRFLVSLALQQQSPALVDVAPATTPLPPSKGSCPGSCVCVCWATIWPSFASIAKEHDPPRDPVLATFLNISHRSYRVFPRPSVRYGSFPLQPFSISPPVGLQNSSRLNRMNFGARKPPGGGWGKGDRANRLCASRSLLAVPTHQDNQTPAPQPPPPLNNDERNGFSRAPVQYCWPSSVGPSGHTMCPRLGCGTVSARSAGGVWMERSATLCVRIELSMFQVQALALNLK